MGKQDSLRVLGIDPGSIKTGYAVIEIRGKQLHLLKHGTLFLTEGAKPTSDAKGIAYRLSKLYRGLERVLHVYKPHLLALEQVFFAKNVTSALKLGQARGVVLAVARDLEIDEFSPTEVKQSIVGHGRASKDQVSTMVQKIMGKQDFVSDDASDAVAIAICGAHRHIFNQAVDGAMKKQSKNADALTQSRRVRRRMSDIVRGQK